MEALEPASTSFLMAEALEPDNVEAQYYLGIVAERFMDFEEALSRYRRAADLDDADAQYVVAAAEMLIELDRLDEAEAYLDSRRLSFEHSAGVRQTLGHIALLRGNTEKAVELFNEARLLAPDDLGVLEDLTRAQIETGRFAEAEYNLSRLLAAEQNESRRDLKHLRARCLIEVDRPVEARSLLHELTTGPEGELDLRAWIALGQIAQQLNDAPGLRRAATRVVGIAPQRPEGYMFRALTHRKDGNLRKALAAVEQAVERRDDDPTPLVLRGLVQEELGMLDAAEFSYLAALGDDPENAAARRMLDWLETRRTVAGVDDEEG
jgi:Flp pilus assembly protein TadD